MITSEKSKQKRGYWRFSQGSLYERKRNEKKEEPF